jgi:hypothetical protein
MDILHTCSLEAGNKWRMELYTVIFPRDKLLA